MTILEVVLRYWSSKYIKIPSSGCKVPLWCVLTEKRQLKWLYMMFVTVQDDAFGELEICGAAYSEVWQGKTESSDDIRSNQFNKLEKHIPWDWRLALHYNSLSWHLHGSPKIISQICHWLKNPMQWFRGNSIWFL